jgi:uncharacterized protein (DUF2235 family)
MGVSVELHVSIQSINHSTPHYTRYNHPSALSECVQCVCDGE